jgi:hypothetical protein
VSLQALTAAPSQSAFDTHSANAWFTLSPQLTIAATSAEFSSRIDPAQLEKLVIAVTVVSPIASEASVFAGRLLQPRMVSRLVRRDCTARLYFSLGLFAFEQAGKTARQASAGNRVLMLDNQARLRAIQLT